MARHVLTPLCGPDCRYRGLYEGTQTSLSDMAARQASALGRVGRLRSGIVASLKRSFGRQFADAERQIGQRMSDLEDEVLLAYLGSFLSLASLSTQPEGLEVLREALVTAGFALPPGNDLMTWAESIRAQGPQAAPVDDLADLFGPDATPAAPEPAAAAAPPARSRRALRRPAAEPAPEPEPVAVVAATVPQARKGPGSRSRKPRTEQLPSAASLEDLFDDMPEPSAPLHDPYQDIPLPDEEPYDSYGEPDYDAYDEPAPTTRTPVEPERQPETVAEVAPGPVETPAVPVEETVAAGATANGRRRLTRRDEIPAEVPQPAAGEVDSGPVNDLADLFADEPAPEQVPAPSRSQRRPDPVEEVAPVTAAAAESGPLVAPVRKTRVRKTAAAKQPVEEAPAEQAEPAPAQEAPAEQPPAAVGAGEERPARTRSSRQRSGEAAAPQQPSQPTVLGLPLRPELMPAPAPRARGRKTGVKQVRASALPPDAKLFDVPPETIDATGGELTDEVRNALLAQVCIPRPVFAADLTAYTGSADVVATWETEQRGSNDSPVRFIPPKARHRARGSLILPSDFLRTAATEFTRSIWAECMKRYRGAKLYELGVLLHRLNDEVVGQRLGEHTVLLRLNQPRGLVGVVVVTDAALEEDSPARAALCADVAELLSERLTLVAVLTTNAEALEPAINALTEEAERRRWSVAMPVVAARSWEYAEDRGSSATLVLGG